MNIVVIGYTGLIGTKVVADLRQLGHQVITASPVTGKSEYYGGQVSDTALMRKMAE